MNIRLGEKIRTLRKAKNISQEVLAQYLGVSFQAVSKWENGSAMPDVAMIPAIATFFEVSTDEMFDFNRLDMEKKVEKLCFEAYKFRVSDPARSEQMLRDALKQYPGNEIILNNLLYTMRVPERNQEVVTLCKAILEITKLDEVKYDVLRILAETYKEMGEYELCKTTLQQIPEIYFTKLQLEALHLDGDDSFEPACEQKDLAAEMLVDMMMRLADYYESKGEHEKAIHELKLVQRIAEVMKDDQPNPFHEKTFYEYYGREVLEKVTKRLEAM